MLALNAIKPGLHHAQSGAALPPQSAIFLHTSWRSGGTWLWGNCRALPGVHALYEPLHEAIADLRASDIARLRPDSWQSGHSATAPYFAEYTRLIRPAGCGVPLYEPRFAFDDFFRTPDQDDPALEAYVRSLLAAPERASQVAVLKFCRSLGRVGWFERRFPDALHAVVLRRPLEQWHSGHRLMIQGRNRYFTVAPILVLARNAENPLVRQACGALGVQLPRLDSPDTAYGMETVWRWVKRQSTADQYRAFLAFWTLTAICALRGQALLIDTARLALVPDDRRAAEGALQARLGTPINLVARAPLPADPAGGPSPEALQAAHAQAALLVQAHSLAPQRLASLLGCLALPGQELSAGDPVLAEYPACVQGQASAAWLVGAQVAFARGLQPLRRLHGRIAK